MRYNIHINPEALPKWLLPKPIQVRVKNYYSEYDFISNKRLYEPGLRLVSEREFAPRLFSRRKPIYVYRGNIFTLHKMQQIKTTYKVLTS